MKHCLYIMLFEFQLLGFILITFLAVFGQFQGWHLVQKLSKLATETICLHGVPIDGPIDRQSEI